MPFSIRTTAAKLLLSVILSLVSACTENPAKNTDAVPTTGHDSQLAQGALGKMQPEMGRSAPFSKPLRRLDGTLDLENRYAYTLRVKAASSSPAKECSGALIAPRVVLTTAHCVCMQRKISVPSHGDRILLDSSKCVETATVTAVTYLPLQPDGAMRTLNEVYVGAVRPHPAFKLLLTVQDSVESSQANIALILLENPVSDHFHPTELAQAEVTKGEVLVMVGYGDDDSGTNGGDARRFSKHRVMESPKNDGDVFTLAAPIRPSYQADSGGPCLREAHGTQLLVGTSLRGLGAESKCTSTHFYEAWLQDEVRRATQAGPSANP